MKDTIRIRKKNVILGLIPFLLAFSRLSFGIQPGTPLALPNFINPVAACSWSGVAGQVFDRTGSPVNDLTVVLGGYWGGQPVSQLAASGSAAHIGPGGFEFMLSSTVLATQGEVYLQLFDSDGTPLSGRVFFDTYANCDQNLVVVNIKEASSVFENILPLIPVSP